ncbi:hypothetical protein OG875_02320 [Streptomyces sp. NBC_01498]|uniref:DUF6777 domain-containing protein n=1 Tax=Streptomyces sp. NBC_01498 TaxID=2975870 RepID=UPI002E7AFAC0|nr:DUF6777 domain-containing protein [Streptomyces sp. NBC_01498]WTL23537.1 hypothetical protein OG875_02320 [Streptomyces sp. NBC_01498]
MRRVPLRSRHPALAVLSAGILITAGCGEDGAGGDTRAARTAKAASAEVTLLPLAAPGPDPFTRSTAVPDTGSTAAPAPSTPAAPSASATPGSRAVRSLSGATAGLYGATRPATSCDVPAGTRLLTADRAKAAAFARVAGVAPASLPGFLRGLTPVVLRADVRVTDHGYRDGSPAAFQAVLQSGTAVLVDDRGLPRVRCAGGNPLRPAVAPRTDTVPKGTPWRGYRADRVVVVNRASRALTSLLIVDAAGTGWLERPTGTAGARDRKPEVEPPYPPDTDLVDPPTEPPVPDDGGPESPDPGRSDPAVPEPDAPESDPAPSPDCPAPDAPAPDEPWSEDLTDPECPAPPGRPDSGVDPDYPVMPMAPERPGDGGPGDDGGTGGPAGRPDEGTPPGGGLLAAGPGGAAAGPGAFRG